MAKKTINIGTSPNARDGDTLRVAFNKVNENFNEIYALTNVDSFTELAQDYAAAMFVNGDHVGVTVTYDDVNNKMSIMLEEDLDGGAASTVYDEIPTIDGGGA
jgi:hypothetical protein